MSGDPSVFVFGQLATPQHLAEEAGTQLAGLFHGARIEPRDPEPGQPVEVIVDAGVEAGIGRVLVRYAVDGNEPTPQSPVAEAVLAETRWDELAWKYVDRWVATLPEQPEGSRVRYLVEGGESANCRRVWADGRSSQEPADIFGYTVDRFSTPSWVRDAIIYQIFVDRFFDPGRDFGRPLNSKDEIYGGTLDGVTAQLPYLEELGVNALWLTPVFESETYHGYDALDFRRVAQRVGGEEALRRLEREAHARRVRILLDFAPNHCSWHNPIFLDAQRHSDSAYRNWFTFDEWPHRYRTFSTARYLPQLNTQNPEVVRYLCDTAAYYLTEFDVDGYRLDHAIGPPLGFWSELRAATKRAKGDAYTVGEATVGPSRLRQYEGRLDGCLDFPTLQAYQRFFVHRRIDAAAFHSFVAHNDDFYQPGFSHPTFLDNHDMNRFLWTVDGDTRRLKLAATCQFSMRQPPIVYYGTEVGMGQHEGVSEGGFEAARYPMQWDQGRDRDLYDFYRLIIQARKDHASLRSGERRALFADGALFAYECLTDDDRVVVALNNTGEAVTVDLPGVRGVDLLSGDAVRDRTRLAAFQPALITCD